MDIRFLLHPDWKPFPTMLLSIFFLFSPMPNLAAEKNDSTTNVVGKIFEGHVLNLAPFRLLHTNGLFKCAHACGRLHRCYYLNYQSSLKSLGRCELFQTYLLEEDMHRMLLPKPGFVFVKTLEPMVKSCLEIFRLGPRKSGKYKIFDEKSERTYDVYCDFTSEPGMTWTLVSSLRTNKLFPFSINYPIQEEQPNWNNYRLCLSRMEALRNLSSHWRITCNFPTDGVDYRDYIQANFSEVDFIHFEGLGLCRRVNYINIRGFNCSSCLAPLWQQASSIQFHTDSSSFNRCGDMSLPGALSSEDNFGYYRARNAAFRCTKDQDSTTNWWIGGYS